MELTQTQVFAQVVKRARPGIITENTYPEGADGRLFYHSTRNRGRCCLLCRHWTAPRDLRQARRFLVVLANGRCRLGETPCVEGRSLHMLQHEPHVCHNVCPKFEKISELMTKNMARQQRYHKQAKPRKPS